MVVVIPTYSVHRHNKLRYQTRTSVKNAERRHKWHKCIDGTSRTRLKNEPFVNPENVSRPILLSRLVGDLSSRDIVARTIFFAMLGRAARHSHSNLPPCTYCVSTTSYEYGDMCVIGTVVTVARTNQR